MFFEDAILAANIVDTLKLVRTFKGISVIKTNKCT
jgi:hypothetical protein